MVDDYNVAKSFERIEDILIGSMKKNLTLHMTEEQLNGMEWTQWQALQLNAMQQFRQDNTAIFPSEFDAINKKIEDILKTTYTGAATNAERQLLKYYINKKKKLSAKAQKDIYKLHEDKLKALIDETVNNFKKAEHAILRTSDDAYRKIIFDSQVYLQTGGGTLTQAIDMATKDFLSQGLNCIQYKNGNLVNIASYSEMALRTANTRAGLQGEAYKRDEWGEPLVMVTYRSSACPRCVRFIGKVFVDDVYGTTGKSITSKYPKLSSAIDAGLYHPNCKDSHTTYFEGITERKEMTKVDKDEAVRRYNLQQQQRYNERQIRKYKRLEQGSIDKSNIDKYAAKRKEWQKINSEFIKQNDDVLRRDYSREKVRVQDVSDPTNALQNLNKQAKLITTKSEALDSLKNDVGFVKVMPAVSRFDERLLITNTNKFNELENRFHAVSNSQSPYLAGKRCRSLGYVTHYKDNPSEQYMTLNSNVFENTYDNMCNLINKNVQSGWFITMDTSNKDNLANYIITHEYGHMLQNTMFDEYMKNNNAIGSIAEKMVTRQCYTEILDIARKNNPLFDISSNLSKYGKSNLNEFFAEVFAGSQLGGTNELCEAMRIWLAQRGY